MYYLTPTDDCHSSRHHILPLWSHNVGKGRGAKEPNKPVPSPARLDMLAYIQNQSDLREKAEKDRSGGS